MKRLKENLTTETYLTNRDHKICVEQRQILREYGQLATRSELSEWEADRLAEILELAEEDKVLSFLINEIDISIELSANDLLTPHLLQGNVLLADLSLAMGDPLTALKVNEGLAKATEFLAQFASSGNFTDKLQVAFGDNFDRGLAQGIGLEWAKDNFGDLPKIQVLSAQGMGGANRAYASSTNTVYLSKDFVDHSSLNAITSVILEEVGHSIDARINRFDTAGDEGDIFSRIIQNQTLDNTQLAALNVEDDHGWISVGGVQVQLAIKKAKENPYMSFWEGCFSDDLWGWPRMSMSCWVGNISDLFLDAFEYTPFNRCSLITEKIMGKSNKGKSTYLNSYHFTISKPSKGKSTYLNYLNSYHFINGKLLNVWGHNADNPNQSCNIIYNGNDILHFSSSICGYKFSHQKSQKITRQSKSNLAILTPMLKQFSGFKVLPNLSLLDYFAKLLNYFDESKLGKTSIIKSPFICATNSIDNYGITSWNNDIHQYISGEITLPIISIESKNGNKESLKTTLENNQILKEYVKLVTCSELSEWEADRLAEILELAEHDKTLSFLINEIDNYIDDCDVTCWNNDIHQHISGEITLPIISMESKNGNKESLKTTLENNQILKEYVKLVTCSELSEWEADRLAEILELAEHDKTLSFLINEIDNLSQFSEHQSINDLKNQQARLKEFIGVHLDSEIPDYFDCPTKKFTFLLFEMYLR